MSTSIRLMWLLIFRFAFLYANSFIHIAFVADFLWQLPAAILPCYFTSYRVCVHNSVGSGSAFYFIIIIFFCFSLLWLVQFFCTLLYIKLTAFPPTLNSNSNSNWFRFNWITINAENSQVMRRRLWKKEKRIK